jgi:tetratricopeptide (TPR) repeat protein
MARPLRIYALLAAAAVVSTTLAGALPKAKEQWIEVRTANFTLYGDAPPKLTESVGLNLERLRRALTSISDKEVRSPIPSYIYVFKNSRSYERYAGSGTAGLFTSDEIGNYVAIDADPLLNPFEIVYHEYIHYYLHNNSRSPIPTWFDEGMAEYYSTFTVSDNQVEIGRPIPSHVAWLSSFDMIPLGELFAITTESPVYNEGEKRGVFYAESWAVVHYLHSGERAPQLTAFLKMLEGGLPTDEAFHAAFDTTYDALLDEVRAYIAKDSYPFTRYTFKQLSIDERVSIETLGREDLLYRLGDYLAHQGPERSGDAEEHFRAALELQPGHAGALSGLGFVRDRAGDREQAAKLYAASLERDPDNFVTHLLLGTNLVERERQADSGPVDPAQPLSPLLVDAREHFRRTIELNPGAAYAYAGFGYTYVRDPGAVEPGLGALEKALALMPGSEAVAFNLFTLELRSGNREAAEELERTILSRSDDPEIRTLTREALLREEMHKVDALFQEGRNDEAVALITRIRNETTDPGLRAHLDGALAEVGRVARMREAFDLAQAGRLEEAEAMLTELAGQVVAPEQREIVEQVLEQIRARRSEP